MAQSSFDSTELPAVSPRSHCVLMPRDPNSIFAYWNCSEGDINRASQQFGSKSEDAKLTLRIYDTTGIEFNGSNANHISDIEVGFTNKNSYIQVGRDNADYCVQLGLSGGANDFIVLTSSNTVHTPPMSTSKRNDLIWQDIKAHKESSPFIVENIDESVEENVDDIVEEQVKEDIKDRRYPDLKQPQLKKDRPQAKPQKRPRVYHLTPQDIRDYYMHLFAKVSQKGKGKRQSPLQDFLMENFSKGGLKDVSWQKVRPILNFPDLLKRAHPGASESLSSFQLGASEGRLNVRNFFFEIWTELVVHGRTEPDAAVWLEQKGIQLNPDGTFTLRYSLPDGEIPLNFIAQSADGIEQRHIYTGVERQKTNIFSKTLETNG